ncbi:hypothetical protein Tco_1025421 [Tanacetum coccineum]
MTRWQSSGVTPVFLDRRVPPRLTELRAPETARMAVCVPPAMSSGLSASMTGVATISESGRTSELVEDSEEDDDEEDEEIDESMDSDNVSEDAEDEGPTAEDEDPAVEDNGLTAGVEGPGMDNEGYGLDDESRGIDDEGHSVEMRTWFRGGEEVVLGVSRSAWS